MMRPPQSVAMTAMLAALALVAAACSPKTPAADRSAAATPSPALAAQSGTPSLAAACQSLLTTMQSCSDNLTAKGSPLGQQIRLSMDDMRTSIAAAPPAEQSSFCDTEASAFKKRAQAAHC